MNAIEDSEGQVAAVQRFFDALASRTDRMPGTAAAPAEELAENDT